MKSAVVLLSGGLDSATTLAIASKKYKKIHTLGFSYGQRHSREVDSAKKLAAFYKTDHTMLNIPLPWKGSALLDRKMKVPKGRRLKEMGSGIPSTYVPARNTLFLSYALSLAEVKKASVVFIGANALDYSGYPDCRPRYLKAMERVFTLGTKQGVEGKGIRIEAPLLKLSKAEIVSRGKKLKVPFKLTWSCYIGGKRPCSKCDSCLLRAKGFEGAGVKDPLTPTLSQREREKRRKI